MTIHQDAGVQRKSTARTVRWLGVGAVLLLGVLLATGILPRLARQQRIVAEETTATAVPAVTVAVVKPGKGSSELTLPANMLGMHEVGLYPRSNGYVAKFTVDIGSHVTAGQSMAIIETPELDQDLSVSRATLEQVLATSELTRTTLERWKGMISSGAVTKQEFDEKQAAYNVSTANVSAARATLERLTQLKKFGNIVAPFAGVVTSRSVDVGMLVSSTVTTGTRPLFTIAQTDTMRVIMQVPQDAAPSIRIGQEVDVLVQELGSTAFHGKVSRTSEAIDPTTRTLTTSVLVMNGDGRLRPGMYAQVKFTTQRSQTALVIPANTLIIRADGPQAAVVRDGKVHMAKLTLGRDFGTSIEALSGLKAGDQIIINPGDDVAEGSLVRIVEPRGSQATGDAKKAS